MTHNLNTHTVTEEPERYLSGSPFFTQSSRFHQEGITFTHRMRKYYIVIKHPSYPVLQFKKNVPISCMISIRSSCRYSINYKPHVDVRTDCIQSFSITFDVNSTYAGAYSIISFCSVFNY